MGNRPKKPCAAPGCPAVVTDGSRFCPDCEKERRRQYQQVRSPDNDFYRTPRWRAFSRRCLRKNPRCKECLAEGRFTPSKVADHRIPRRERPDLEFSESNIDCLCVSHHNAKSARELQEQRRKTKEQASHAIPEEKTQAD